MPNVLSQSNSHSLWCASRSHFFIAEVEGPHGLHAYVLV